MGSGSRTQVFVIEQQAIYPPSNRHFPSSENSWVGRQSGLAGWVTNHPKRDEHWSPVSLDTNVQGMQSLVVLGGTSILSNS